MRNWPKWLRITFIVSGSLFVLALLFIGYVRVTHAVIPPLTVPRLPTGDQPQQPTSEPTPIVNYITAIAGLITAASGFYGQILAGRKQELDYKLAQQQMKMQARNGLPRKTNRKRKKR